MVQSPLLREAQVGRMNTACDVIIVGAGPAGSTAAILLARAGRSVAIIEQHAFPRRKVCGECIAAPNLPLLDALGVGPEFDACAGPELRRVALMTGTKTVIAELPAFGESPHPWGRVLGRDYLDALLLRRAAACGAQVWQPWRVRNVIPAADGRSACQVVATASGATVSLTAPVVIAANGSWNADPFEVDSPRRAHRGSDLFAFKGNFRHASLANGLLPVLAFPDGYGGLVVGDHARLTFAFCLRRERLRQCRRHHPGLSAAAAACEYVQRQVPEVRVVLDGAEPDASWLAVGPVDPVIRSPWRGNGVFAIGNAAGEAHPILGEGISMALQSAWLLCGLLIAHGPLAESRAADAIGCDYDRQWRRCFAPRIRFAALFAQAAMHTAPASVLRSLVHCWPGLLTRGARMGGKVRPFRQQPCGSVGRLEPG